MYGNDQVAADLYTSLSYVDKGISDQSKYTKLVAIHTPTTDERRYEVPSVSTVCVN